MILQGAGADRIKASWADDVERFNKPESPTCYMKNKFVLTLVWLLTTAAALGQNLIPLPNRCR